MKPDESPRRPKGSVEVLVAALARGHTVAAAAKEARMSPATAYRRLSEVDVRKRLDEVRLCGIERAMDRLSTFSLGAADVLAGIAADTTCPPSVRVSAASNILSRVLSYRDGVTVESRLADIESVLEARERAAAGRDRWSVPA